MCFSFFFWAADYDIGVGFLESPFQGTAFVTPVTGMLKAGAKDSPNDLEIALTKGIKFIAMAGMGFANKTYLCI